MSLSDFQVSLLHRLLDGPQSASQYHHQPLVAEGKEYRALRQLLELGLVRERDLVFTITEAGLALLPVYDPPKSRTPTIPGPPPPRNRASNSADLRVRVAELEKELRDRSDNPYIEMLRSQRDEARSEVERLQALLREAEKK